MVSFWFFRNILCKKGFPDHMSNLVDFIKDDPSIQEDVYDIFKITGNEYSQIVDKMTDEQRIKVLEVIAETGTGYGIDQLALEYILWVHISDKHVFYKYVQKSRPFKETKIEHPIVGWKLDATIAMQ